MFGSSRIAELEAHIAKLEAEAAGVQAHGQGIFQYGQKQGQQVAGYYEQYLIQIAQQAQQLAQGGLPHLMAGWDEALWSDWDPAKAGIELFGSGRKNVLQVDGRTFGGVRVGSLTEPRAGKFVLPAFAPFIGQHQTIILHGTSAATALLQSLVVRTALMLPYQVSYTLIDPAGAGYAFPMQRNLADVHASTGEIYRNLLEVQTDIERIISQYLDPQVTSFEMIPFETRSNERYHLVFAADFPNQYDRRDIEALQRIANTGSKAGVYLFIHQNPSVPLPNGMTMDGFKQRFIIDLSSASVAKAPGYRFTPDPAPDPKLQETLFRVLKDAKPPDSSVEWDDRVGLPETAWWQGDASAMIETPIGVQGSGDLLDIWFGADKENHICAHGMLGAMTGAGKSNLFHVLITGFAIRYSPAELRMYLIDGKDGVEFRPYKDLPHAEVVSLNTPGELSRSVLTELIAEKERRNAIFSRTGVVDLASYRQIGQPAGNMPRILLLIDEYQQLFEGDRDNLASNYLLQLVQQGRSVGIHMLLASQRFGAVGMLNQTSVFANVSLRAAMMMPISDVEALTEFRREGKALIARCDTPGKIVLNAQGGSDGANEAGKVVLLRSERRTELVQRLRSRADALPADALPSRVIFNGKAQPQMVENPQLRLLLAHTNWPNDKEMETFARTRVEAGGPDISDWFAAEHPYIAWLGQEFSVRGQARMILRRRIGEHALLVGSAGFLRYGMLAGILSSIGANASPTHTRFVIVDRCTPGAEWSQALPSIANQLLTPAGFDVKYTHEREDVLPILNDLIVEMDRRRALKEADLNNEPSILVVMTELDDVDGLRRRADAYGMTDSPNGQKLQRIYFEGAPMGIHLLLAFSGVKPMTYVVDERRALPQFRHRIALQMSEDESFIFARSRKAAQLQDEGPRPFCALYIDTENDRSVRFKPYSMSADTGERPLEEQIQELGRYLAHWRA